MRKNPSSIRTLLFEIISVAIGIILGFIVNEWREDLSEKKKAQVALERILSEVDNNISLVNVRQPYYKMLIDSMANWTREGEVDVTILDTWQGTNPPLFTESAYSVALSTGSLDYLDAELAAKITGFYACLRSFGSFSEFSVANTLLVDEEARARFYSRTITLYEEYSRICQRIHGNLETHLASLKP